MTFPSASRELRQLFKLSRILRQEQPSLPELVNTLWPESQSFQLSSLNQWDADSLSQARHFAEEITVFFTSYFHDLSQLPVTFYKREKWIRRHFDSEFSRLFKEIITRSKMPLEKELIIEEPIYFLSQMAREKAFPKEPGTKGKRPHLETLKIRFHNELARRLDSEDSVDGDRRVLLPYEL